MSRSRSPVGNIMMFMYLLSPIWLVMGIALIAIFYEYQKFNTGIMVGTVFMIGGLAGSLNMVLPKSK